MSSLLHQAHALLRTRLKNGDFAIDATVGNGHDTVFLAQQVAPTGLVYGFDVQAAAIEATTQRIAEAHLSACVRLSQIGHQFMASEIPANHHGCIKAIMFNLGYLPRGNKSLITQGDTTIIALKAATQLLCAGGIITILAYPGHVGGDIETARVTAYCQQLNGESFALQIIESQHPKPSAPRLLALTKNTDIAY
jgi:predicted methyltransferase